MINRFEAIGVFISVGFMALALFLLNMDQNSLNSSPETSAAVVVANENSDISEALQGSVDDSGSVRDLIVDDVVLGVGEEVKEGDTISVHYIGTLQGGQQFDNSYIKGEPFEFTAGEGTVMKGWEQGILGMKEGGQRILVIPSELAYGKRGAGPIPPNATLIFAIELLEIK